MRARRCQRVDVDVVACDVRQDRRGCGGPRDAPVAARTTRRGAPPGRVVLVLDDPHPEPPPRRPGSRASSFTVASPDADDRVGDVEGERGFQRSIRGEGRDARKGGAARGHERRRDREDEHPCQKAAPGGDDEGRGRPRELVEQACQVAGSSSWLSRTIIAHPREGDRAQIGHEAAHALREVLKRSASISASVRKSHAPMRNQSKTPVKAPPGPSPSAHASIDLPLPPAPTSAMRAGPVASTARTSVASPCGARPRGAGVRRREEDRDGAVAWRSRSTILWAPGSEGMGRLRPSCRLSRWARRSWGHALCAPSLSARAQGHDAVALTWKAPSDCPT